MILDEVKIVMENLGETRGKMYRNHDNKSVEKLSWFLEQKTTQKNLRDFVKFMSDYRQLPPGASPAESLS